MKLPIVSKKKDLARLIGTAVSLVALLLCIADVSVAETGTEGAVMEEVVVRGIRSSLNQALDLKKDAVGSRDSIMADDIGKMPDLNLAESLQRISGVAITRHNGEGQTISVRGLDPQFTHVNVNGMGISVASTGPEFGGRAPGRTVDLDIFPSELFGRVDVNKTQTAKMEEGGIGGAVDMYTPKPFDFDGFNVNGSLQGGYNSYSEETDPRGFLMFSNTFADDTLGLLVAGAYHERSIQGEGASAVSWTSADADGFIWNYENGVPPGVTEDELNSAFVPRLPRSELQQNERDRLGLTASLQWRPSSDFELDFDVLISEMETDTSIYLLDAVFRNQRDVIPIAATIENGNLATGTFDNVDRRAESVFITTETDFSQTVLNGSWEASENLSFTGLVGYSESSQARTNETSYLFTAFDTRVDVDFRGKLPSITTDVDLLDADSYDSNLIRIRPSDIDDTTFTAKFDGMYGDYASNIEFGIHYSKFEKDRVDRRNDLSGLEDVPVSMYAVRIPESNLASDLGAPAGFPGTHLIADPNLGESVFGVKNATATAQPNVLDTNTITESQLAGFVAANHEGEFLGGTVRFNAGLRVVETTSEAVGGALAGGVPTTSKQERTYTDVLPFAAVAWNITDEVTTRLAFGRTITRPSLSALVPRTSITIGRTVVTGNPDLDPFRSNNADFSVDWYFQEGASLSAAVFYKEIDGFIVTENSQVLFSSLGISLSSLDASGFAGVTPDALFTASRPVNGNTGKVRGVEFSYQQQLDFLLTGLGILTNYTYADSSVDFISGDTTVEGTMPGLSKNSWNLIAYYETDAFGMRVAVNDRSEFAEGSAIIDATGQVRTRGDAQHVDASAYYNVTDNLTLTLEGINLTDEEEFTYIGDESRSHRYIGLGRQFFAGVRWDY